MEEFGNGLLKIVQACNLTRLNYRIHANTEIATSAGVNVMATLDDLETNEDYTIGNGETLLTDLNSLLTEWLDRWRDKTGTFSYTVTPEQFTLTEA